jgi:YHS domain-containing protein
MPVDSARTTHKTEHEGVTHYFCGAGCREKFEAEPGRYLSGAKAALASKTEASAKSAPAGTIYTCPMHPQIRQDHPGNCARLSSTIRRFSSADQKRRRRVSFWFVARSTRLGFIDSVHDRVDGHYPRATLRALSLAKPSRPGGPRRRIT